MNFVIDRLKSTGLFLVRQSEHCLWIVVAGVNYNVKQVENKWSASKKLWTGHEQVDNKSETSHE